jgi:hypothetical protein
MPDKIFGPPSTLNPSSILQARNIGGLVPKNRYKKWTKAMNKRLIA